MRDNLLSNIEVMQGFSEGKTIEVAHKGMSDWKEAPDPIWNFQDLDYRIKPIQIRPYTPKELVAEIKVHGPILKYKEGNEYYCITDFGEHTMGIGDSYNGEFCCYDYKEYIDNYVWGDDESPFGVIEEYK